MIKVNKLNEGVIRDLIDGGSDSERNISFLKKGFRKFAAFVLRREYCGDIGGIPRLPVQSGAANILVALPKMEERRPIRSAFIFPVVWRRGESHSPFLPQGLADFADSVAESLSDEKDPTKFAGWKLHPWFSGIDFSSWREIIRGWDSAWGALAAGLYLAQSGGRANPDVFLSIAWGPKGPETVAMVEEKTRVAMEFGARKVYVSAARPAGAEADEFSDVLEYVPINETKPRAVLAQALYQMEVEPTIAAGDTHDECCAYATRQIFPTLVTRDEYLFDNVAPSRADILRNENVFLFRDQFETAIILVSQFSALVLSLLTFRPKNYLAIIATREEKRSGWLKPKLESHGYKESPPHRMLRFFDADSPEKLPGIIEKYLFDLPQESGKMVVDVTGFPVASSLYAGLFAASRDMELISFQTLNQSQSGGHTPGQETIMRILWPRP